MTCNSAFDFVLLMRLFQWFSRIAFAVCDGLITARSVISGRLVKISSSRQILSVHLYEHSCFFLSALRPFCVVSVAGVVCLLCALVHVCWCFCRQHTYRTSHFLMHSCCTELFLLVVRVHSHTLNPCTFMAQVTKRIVCVSPQNTHTRNVVHIAALDDTTHGNSFLTFS